MRHGCINCIHCMWSAEDNIYYCEREKAVGEETFDRVWLNEEDWDVGDIAICPEYRECGAQDY